MTHIFKVPFATQGDKKTIPVEVQADGSLSYTQGYGYDYERDQMTDPAAKDIEREGMNGIFHDLSAAIGEVQIFGYAKWSEAGAPYPIRGLVYHNKKAWQSKIENNNIEPVAGAAWAELKADLTAADIDAYTKGDADKKFQPLGNYQAAGYSYSKAESDTNYQPKGNYAPAGNYAMKGDSYTKVEGDGRYQVKGNYAPVADYAMKGDSYTKAEADNRHQPKGDYQAAGYSYSKVESDNNYQPKGNYAPTGNYAYKGDSYTKAESDNKYQPKGSYQAAGYSYSKTESDNRYQFTGSSYSKTESDNRYLGKNNNVRVTERVVWTGRVQDRGDMVCTESIAGCLVYLECGGVWLPTPIPVTSRKFNVQWPGNWWGAMEFISPKTLRFHNGSQIMTAVLKSV